MTRRIDACLLLAAALACLAAPQHAPAAGKPPVPDLTRGGQRDTSADWTLGPTGARGWIWGWRGHTTDARQVLITDVAQGAPADGVLRPGDVLLGVDDKPFADDARLCLARAVTEAEQQARAGRLRLLRWRDGQTQAAEVRLPVLGTYAPTAPFDCPKSARILDLGCRAIAKKGLPQVSIPNNLNALALLASGREEYRSLVADYARKVADHQPGGHVTWGYAYATLFLAEYALAARDEAVLPGLRRLALDIARGQSGVGTWGHAFARPDGILNGYGAMNQPGIVLALAMALAREAGVRDPVLDRAIDKAARFLRWYVHKGAVPYGDHAPWPWHEDNGKCSSAAVLFDLLGDRDAAAFFSRMGTAAHAERESGHTGCFFNVLWALPGVARAGPLAAAAYLKETAWYYDLARAWDGAVVYQPVPGNWGGHQYGGWDCTGAYLLGYALPLKRLYLTGRRPPAAPALTRDQTAEVIAAGRDFNFWTEKTAYDARHADALLAGLASWSPAVRIRSAEALGQREGDFVPRLLALLARPDPNARYGACLALGALGPRADAAAARLRALLADSDPWVTCLAADALARLGPDARTLAVPDLLRLATRPNPADPRRMVQRAVGIALFSPMPGSREPKSILADSLDGVDRDLLYPAVKALLDNEDGATRGLVRPVYARLTDRDLVALLPAIVKAVQAPSPSGEMFADGIRLAGLDLVSRLRIREGMAMALDLLEPARWGADGRIPRCLESLGRYGGNARPLLPQLQEVRQALVKRDRKLGEKSNLVVALDKTLARIEADKTPPALLGLADFAAGARPAR